MTALERALRLRDDAEALLAEIKAESASMTLVEARALTHTLNEVKGWLLGAESVIWKQG